MSASLLAEQRDSARVAGFGVSKGGWKAYFNFRAGADFAPEVQLCADLLRAFPNSRQSPVAGALAFLQYPGINSRAIVSDSQSEQT
jgi:hypothetical protein